MLHLRLDRPSYRPGDVVTATLQIATDALPGTAIHVDALTVQAFGSERVDPSWVSPAYHAGTVVVEQDSRRITRDIFRTQPKHVLAHCQLAGLARRSFMLRLKLPDALPPTFRGGAARFSYALEARLQYSVEPEVINNTGANVSRQGSAGRLGFLRYSSSVDSHGAGTTAVQQRVQKECLAKLPVLVWPFKGTSESIDRRAVAAPSSPVQDEAPVLHYQMGCSGSDLLLSCEEVLDLPAAPPRDGDLLAAPSPSYAGDNSLSRSFALRIGASPLVRLGVHEPLDGPLRLGSTLAGTLDFRASHEAAILHQQSPKCAQVIILLETEECVCSPWQVARRAHAAPGLVRKVYDEHQELTMDTLLSHFIFSIPYDAPASFSTELLNLRWLLRFEFTAIPSSAPGGWQQLSRPVQKPEQITWVLPLVVQPP
ncbi:hypothetical protein WJX72_003654 [[Myrmecia] bisecta]|uniref:Uncharacterized protein n=1 Tax=[Myrmecia] bisecta TaxID=41462 RepID=A0AAW1Q1W1_9CHLO